MAALIYNTSSHKVDHFLPALSTQTQLGVKPVLSVELVLSRGEKGQALYL